MTAIIGGIYYFISPYQNCLRTVDKKIEEVRNKLATETDVKTREELEQERLINQTKIWLFGKNQLVRRRKIGRNDVG